MDFRLGFGGVFGAETKLIVADRFAPGWPPRRSRPDSTGRSDTILSALAGATLTDHEVWIAGTIDTARAGEAAELADDRTALHPMRVYAELSTLLDRDAIVVIDDGLRLLRRPGHRQLRAGADSGPFGCLGSHGETWPPSWPGPTDRWCCCRAMRVRVSVVWCLWRMQIPGPWRNIPWRCCTATLLVANRGRAPAYNDEVVTALGGHGGRGVDAWPALERAFSATAVVNALTDPTLYRAAHVRPELPSSGRSSCLMLSDVHVEHADRPHGTLVHHVSSGTSSDFPVIPARIAQRAHRLRGRCSRRNSPGVHAVPRREHIFRPAFRLARSSIATWTSSNHFGRHPDIVPYLFVSPRQSIHRT